MSHATETSALSQKAAGTRVNTPQVSAEDTSLLAANLEEDIPATQPRNEAYYMGTPPHQMTQDDTRGQQITQD